MFYLKSCCVWRSRVKNGSDHLLWALSCSFFFRKFGVLFVFLLRPFWNLPFCLITDELSNEFLNSFWNWVYHRTTVVKNAWENRWFEMQQWAKWVKDCFNRSYYIRFLKTVFQKFYLVNFWILCLKLPTLCWRNLNSTFSIILNPKTFGYVVC